MWAPGPRAAPSRHAATSCQPAPSAAHGSSIPIRPHPPRSAPCSQPPSRGALGLVPSSRQGQHGDPAATPPCAGAAPPGGTDRTGCRIAVCYRDRKVRGHGAGPQERPHHPGVPEPGARPGGGGGDPGGHRQPQRGAAPAGQQLAGLGARLRRGGAAGGEASGRAGEQRRRHRYAPRPPPPRCGPTAAPRHCAPLAGLPFGLTPEGLERTFATNYLGPFLLTNLLLDLMKASAPARIVTVSSFRHSAGSADSRFLTGQARPGGFDPIYNSTKLMNVLFTAELAQRLQGTGVTANSLNPGVVSTGIMRNFSWVVRGLFFLIRPFIKSAEQGAVSTIYCAVSEEVSGISGKYFGSDCSLTLPSATARDAGLARKLWEESERLTGLSP
uniref:Retinol dehydrogenase 14 n=1 Tax=Pavo cristatus TaxID=9049 RepID=A0A8C9FZY4_PAVCR